MPYLNRTEFVLQTSKQHIEAIADTDPNKPLVGVFFTFLVCVSFYSELELKLIDVVQARLALAADPKIASLIVNTQKGILSRLKKSDMADCAELFGPGVRDAFNAAVDDRDVTLYHNIITQRHAVAHNEDGQMLDWRTATLTLLDIENGLAAAERLVAAFEAAIQ